MAARRLIVVLIVLLAISTLAAALVPAPHQPAPATTARQKPQPPKHPTQQRNIPPLIHATLNAADRKIRDISLQPGDELSLTVESAQPNTVEIPAFGLLKAVAPGAPALFDLIVDRRGTFPVRLLTSGRTVGRIIAGPPPPRCGSSSRAPRARGSARACPHRGGHGSAASG